MHWLFIPAVIVLVLIAIMVGLSLWFDIDPDGWPFRIWRRWRK